MSVLSAELSDRISSERLNYIDVDRYNAQALTRKCVVRFRGQSGDGREHKAIGCEQRDPI